MGIYESGIKVVLLVVIAIGGLGIYAGVAKADEVTFTGYSNGCFNCGVPPNTSVTQTNTILSLVYTNSQYNNTTVDGFLAFGGNPTTMGVQGTNNFGQFFLASSLANYNGGNSFTLRLTFTAPTGITGGNSQLFTATVEGAVSGTGTGGVNISFDNSPQGFSFTNPGGPNGSFTLTLNDVSIDPGQNASITGVIRTLSVNQTSSVPEPASLVLLTTGLVGAVGAARKRFKRAS